MQCNFCGSTEQTTPCKHCTTDVCKRCELNHVSFCEKLTARRRANAGATVVRVDPNAMRSVGIKTPEPTPAPVPAATVDAAFAQMADYILPQDIAATPESEAVIEDNGSLAESGDSNEIATMTDVAEALLEALPVTHVAVEPGLRSDLTGASPDAEASVPASEEDEPIS